jgi:hypothetical protein
MLSPVGYQLCIVPGTWLDKHELVRETMSTSVVDHILSEHPVRMDKNRRRDSLI